MACGVFVNRSGARGFSHKKNKKLYLLYTRCLVVNVAIGQ